MMLTILYQDSGTLVVQSHAGEFDKFAADDLYGKFNMGLHVGDRAEQVLDNRANLLVTLNELTDNKVAAIHWLNQIHSDTVINTDDKPQAMPHAGDALTSGQKGQALAIMTADCVPIAVFGGGQVACIHAGWQGLAKGIIKNTLANFAKDAPIQAVIGACISQANYEIDRLLAQNIVRQVVTADLVEPSQDELYQAVIQDTTPDKCLIDIVKLTKLQLAKLGVSVLTCDVPCSYATPNLYSYRAQTHAKKSTTGRMATVIVQF